MSVFHRVFRRLSTKLTVLYAGLFAAVLLVIALVVYSAVAENAASVVRQELTASSTVFDRIWALRTAQLENSAGVLSRDFGFRAAIASHDQATIKSALDNLKVRLGIDTAFMIGADGGVIAAGDARPQDALSPATFAALQSDDLVSGVFVMHGAPYQAISVPVLAPTALGWVVFALKLDQAQMVSLQRLSAIPLDASILDRGGFGDLNAGAWGDAVHRQTSADHTRLDAFVAAQLKAGAAKPGQLDGADGPSIALAKPLPAIDPAQPVVLMLRYPMARAMAPYRILIATMAVIGVFGIGLLALGSWMLARGLTRPISALEEAARRLQRGEAAEVGIETADEIGRLAESFNTMAAAIGERERRITHLALHDADTDLPNRQALEREIITLTQRAGAELSFVGALGVDRFAHVRGAIGHALFGALIRELGARMMRSSGDIRCARLSTSVLGFTLHAADAAQALAMAAELRQALEEPLRLNGNIVDVSLTVGVACCAIDVDRVWSVIDRANIALDQARMLRRQVAMFDASLYGDPASNLSLMSEMRTSIEVGHISLETGSMVLHHQPKFDLRSRAITGTEALVRWIHPKRGFMPPDNFIGMAEETGHIRALTDWVLAQAIEDQRAMYQAGHELAVSVNISGRLLSDPDFAAKAVAKVEGAVGDVCFEITETAVIENPELALSIIERFAAAGIAISIDDYGTGLSSLAYLKQIKANELKIDKSFVFAISESHRDALLVRSTIDLAHSLGLKVTAEGVETETALALLAGMGCDLAQGYLIARPMALAPFLAFMAQDAQAQKASA